MVAQYCRLTKRIKAQIVECVLTGKYTVNEIRDKFDYINPHAVTRVCTQNNHLAHKMKHQNKEVSGTRSIDRQILNAYVTAMYKQGYVDSYISKASKKSLGVFVSTSAIRRIKQELGIKRETPFIQSVKDILWPYFDSIPYIMIAKPNFSKMARETGFSYNTIKKYLAQYQFEKNQELTNTSSQTSLTTAGVET